MVNCQRQRPFEVLQPWRHPSFSRDSTACGPEDPLIDGENGPPRVENLLHLFICFHLRHILFLSLKEMQVCKNANGKEYKK